jgi:hypothetical protein
MRNPTINISIASNIARFEPSTSRIQVKQITTTCACSVKTFRNGGRSPNSARNADLHLIESKFCATHAQ